MRDRTTTPRPNFTPRAARSRWCPCPAGVRVWSACSIPTDATALAAMSDAELSAEIERRAHSLLGKMTRRAGPRPFSARGRDRGCLAPRTASRWSAKRRMSCRRSARRGSISACATAPPSPRSSPTRGAQSLDVGAPEVLARYDSAAPRRRDEPHHRGRSAQPQPAHRISSRPTARADFRSICVDRIGPLRRALMREGVVPAAVAAPADARRDGVSDAIS